jgi:hypothetical protein
MRTTSKPRFGFNPSPRQIVVRYRETPRQIIVRYKQALLAAAPEQWRPQISGAFDDGYHTPLDIDDLIDDVLNLVRQRDRRRAEVLQTGELDTDENRELAVTIFILLGALLGTAARLLEAGDVGKAWHLTDLAAQCILALRCKEAVSFMAVLSGRRGLRERHKENRYDREFVRKWWTENKNRFRSKDAAAEAIVKSGNVRASFKTVRDWLKGA